MDTKYFDKLQDLARSKLIEMGFDKNQLVFAPDATKYREAGHYIARNMEEQKRDNTNCIADGRPLLNKLLHHNVRLLFGCITGRHIC